MSISDLKLRFTDTWILQGSEIWAPLTTKNRPGGRNLTPMEGLGIYLYLYLYIYMVTKLGIHVLIPTYAPWNSHHQNNSRLPRCSRWDSILNAQIAQVHGPESDASATLEKMRKELREQICRQRFFWDDLTDDEGVLSNIIIIASKVLHHRPWKKSA